jgi:hypothetical protein
MDCEFRLTSFEDSLDGLRNTEYDPERIQFINFHMLKKDMTHIGHLERIATFVKDLAEIND